MICLFLPLLILFAFIIFFLFLNLPPSLVLFLLDVVERTIEVHSIAYPCKKQNEKKKVEEKKSIFLTQNEFIFLRFEQSQKLSSLAVGLDLVVQHNSVEYVDEGAREHEVPLRLNDVHQKKAVDCQQK